MRNARAWLSTPFRTSSRGGLPINSDARLSRSLVSGPAARDFDYRDQIRDAIASACRNMSEGFDRFRPTEFARFLEIARGSLGEVKDCLIDGRDRGYINDDQFERLFTLARRAQGTNTNLGKYLRECIAKGKQSWRTKNRGGNTRPTRARRTP
jgi:four helix bundle protein